MEYQVLRVFPRSRENLEKTEALPAWHQQLRLVSEWNGGRRLKSQSQPETPDITPAAIPEIASSFTATAVRPTSREQT